MPSKAASVLSTVAILMMLLFGLLSVNPWAASMSASLTGGPGGYGGPTPTVTPVRGPPILVSVLSSSAGSTTSTEKGSSSTASSSDTSTSQSTSTLVSHSSSAPTSSSSQTSSTVTSTTITTSGNPPSDVPINAFVYFNILNETGCAKYNCSWSSNWVIAIGSQVIWSYYGPQNTGNVGYAFDFSCLYYMQWSFTLSPPYPYTSIEFQITAGYNATVYLDQSAEAPNSLSGTWRPPCVSSSSAVTYPHPLAVTYAIPIFMLITVKAFRLRETSGDQLMVPFQRCGAPIQHTNAVDSVEP